MLNTDTFKYFNFKKRNWTQRDDGMYTISTMIPSNCIFLAIQKGGDYKRTNVLSDIQFFISGTTITFIAIDKFEGFATFFNNSFEGSSYKISYSEFNESDWQEDGLNMYKLTGKTGIPVFTARDITPVGATNTLYTLGIIDHEYLLRDIDLEFKAPYKFKGIVALLVNK